MVDIDGKSEEARVLRTFVSSKNKKILEIGCGSGRLSFVLAKNAKKLIGIDISRKAIELARKNTPEKLKETVIFKVGDSKNLNFERNSLDTVFMAMSLHEIPDKDREKSLEEIHRVLKKGGQLFIIEPLPLGEVQSIYSLFLLRLFNENHPKRIKSAQRVLEKAIEKRIFSLNKRKAFSLLWRFKDFEDLCGFFLKEHKISISDDSSKYFIKSIRSILKNKTESRPLVIKDELVFFDLRNN